MANVDSITLHWELPSDQVNMMSEVGAYSEYSQFRRLSENHGGWSTSPTVGGPGWQRFQRQRDRETTIEGTAIPLGSNNEFTPADRCFHQKFGMGTIEAVDGDHLTIAFDKAGTKRVMAPFVAKV